MANRHTLSNAMRRIAVSREGEDSWSGAAWVLRNDTTKHYAYPSPTVNYPLLIEIPGLCALPIIHVTATRPLLLGWTFSIYPSPHSCSRFLCLSDASLSLCKTLSLWFVCRFDCSRMLCLSHECMYIKTVAMRYNQTLNHSQDRQAQQQRHRKLFPVIMII